MKEIAGDLEYPLIFIAGKRYLKPLEKLFEETMNGTIARNLKDAKNPVRQLTEKELEKRWGPKPQTQEEYNYQLINTLFIHKFPDDGVHLDDVQGQFVSQSASLFSCTV